MDSALSKPQPNCIRSIRFPVDPRDVPRRAPSNSQRPYGAWPRFMRAKTAAAYCDEPSPKAFLRKVGSIYPGPKIGEGRNARWDREDLDRYPEAQHQGGGASLADDL